MIIVGHRGARGEAPENTLAGFRQALRRGVRHFELDLQLSLDGQVMVFHDSGLKRTTGVSGRMTSWSAAALAQLSAHHPWLHHWPDCGIPKLSEVLTALQHASWVQLEIKADSHLRMDRLCHDLLWLLDTFAFRGQAVVTSFNPWVLQHIKALAPDIRTGFVTDDRFRNPVKSASRLGAAFVIPHHSLVTAQLVRQAHDQGLHVSTWTVNRRDDALRVREAGADSLITDYPTSLAGLLGIPLQAE